MAPAPIMGTRDRAKPIRTPSRAEQTRWSLGLVQAEPTRKASCTGFRYDNTIYLTHQPLVNLNVVPRPVICHIQKAAQLIKFIQNHLSR